MLPPKHAIIISYWKSDRICNTDTKRKACAIPFDLLAQENMHGWERKPEMEGRLVTSAASALSH